MTEVNRISFGAKYIDTIRVKKYNKFVDGYLPKKSSFVQIDSENTNDTKALKSICDTWEKAPFLKSVLNVGKDEKIYGLTLQRNNFENLESEKILGLVRMHDYCEKDGTIQYLQVNPKYINVGDGLVIRPDYKGNGSAILKSLKRIYDRLNLVSVDEISVEEFYQHNGFIKEDDWYGLFAWERAQNVKPNKNLFVTLLEKADSVREWFKQQKA